MGSTIIGSWLPRSGRPIASRPALRPANTLGMNSLALARSTLPGLCTAMRGKFLWLLPNGSSQIHPPSGCTASFRGFPGKPSPPDSTANHASRAEIKPEFWFAYLMCFAVRHATQSAGGLAHSRTLRGSRESSVTPNSRTAVALRHFSFRRHHHIAATPSELFSFSSFTRRGCLPTATNAPPLG